LPAPARHSDEHEHRFAISKPTHEDPTLVVCPSCRSKAFVLPTHEAEAAVKVVCHACGFSKRAEGATRRFDWYAENPTDGYFGLDLWLQTRCAGHSLWAFNHRHLDFLERYVSASLRERERDEQGWRNSSLASRLPKWMTAGPNREEVIAAIRVLREKA